MILNDNLFLPASYLRFRESKLHGELCSFGSDQILVPLEFNLELPQLARGKCRPRPLGSIEVK